MSGGGSDSLTGARECATGSAQRVVTVRFRVADHSIVSVARETAHHGNPPESKVTFTRREPAGGTGR